MEVDGMILGDGADALTPGAGGGAGGSILLEAPHFLGENSSVLSFGAPKVFLKKKIYFKSGYVKAVQCIKF